MYRKLNQLLLALFVVVATSLSAKAQDIRYHCQVRGYSGWVRIDPGCRSGGRVIREAGGGLVTDRVMRGEQMMITIADSRDRCRVDVVEAFVSVNGSVRSGGILLTPFSVTGICPTNVNADNVVLSITNLISGRQVSKRVPIGRR